MAKHRILSLVRAMTRIMHLGIPAVMVGLLSWSCVDQPLVALEHRPTAGAGGQSASSQGGDANRGGTSERSIGGGTSSSEPWGFGGGGFDCKPAESTCTRDTECCPSLACRQGVCTQRQCIQVSNVCERGEDCCSGICRFNGGTGLRTCALVNGCRPIGESCVNDLDCCSADCYRGTCSPTSACLKSGETRCDQADSDECCGGTSCVTAFDGSGVARCNPTPCVQEGSSCTHDEACCSSGSRKLSCSWSGGAFKMLCRTCVRLGASCSDTDPCCDGALCSGGTCVLQSPTGAGGAGSTSQGTSTSSCVSLGQSCATANCCSGALCESSSLLCVSKP
ncbi:MAG: hypothetical protein QM784_14255 [Polyangiaceae bacterium]